MTHLKHHQRGTALPRVDSATPRYRLSPTATRELVIVAHGAQQSVCRWLDTGDEICVCNSWLVPAEGRPS